MVSASRKKKTAKNNPRFAALELLVKVSEQQSYSNLLVDQVIRDGDLTPQDARLMTEIVYGTLSRQLTLDYFLAPFVKKAKKLDNWVRQLLRLTLYQMVYLDRVPDHGSVNEAVEIAKIKGNAGIGKFVNGVLRTIQRQGVPAIESIENPIERLSIEVSLPVWLVEKLCEQIGEKETRELGLSLLEPSSVSARVTARELTREEVLEQLKTAGYDVQASEVSPFGIVGSKGFLAGSEMFRSGQLTIQDESSMLVAPSMQIEPQHQVLDACAAPGGKTTHIAQYLDATQGGQVTALDIHAHKVKLIDQNAKRMNVTDVVKTQKMDAREVKTVFSDASFDRILVDAPCSGLGLLRRKPDIRYHKRPEDFERLPSIQLEILESVSQKVKEWGIITYSTCTILSEENEEVVRLFLERNPNFKAIPVEGTDFVNDHSDYGVTLYPHHFNTDGFFISCLQRIS